MAIAEYICTHVRYAYEWECHDSHLIIAEIAESFLFWSSFTVAF